MTKELDGSEIYIVARLVNDMEIMAIMEGEDKQYVKLQHAMEVRVIPEIRDGVKRFTKFAALPLTQLSEDPSYIIDKSHILFIKRLSNDMKQHLRMLVTNPDASDDMEIDEWDSLAEEETGEEIMDNMIVGKKNTYH